MEKQQLVEEMTKIVGADNVQSKEEELYSYAYDATPGHIYMALRKKSRRS